MRKLLTLFVICFVALGAVVTVETSRGPVVLDIREAEAGPEAAPQMRAIYWQTKTETLEHWRVLAGHWKSTPVIVQNRWPGSMADPAKIAVWAAGAKEVGWGFQPYLPAGLDPDKLIGVEWPDNITTAMTASEGNWWDDENLRAMRANIPERIECAFPERTSQERQQIWMRVAPRPGTVAENWAYRSPFLLPLAINTARAEGVKSLAAGPQVYNRVAGAPETDDNIRLSVALIAQASLRSADICFWGAKHISDEANAHIASVLDESIAGANALPILADAESSRGEIGVFVGDGFTVDGLGSIVFAEAVLRSNLPVTYFTDIRRAGEFKAVLIPVLYEHHWSSEEVSHYESYSQQLIDEPGTTQKWIDDRLAQWQRLKDTGWLFRNSFDDETSAWLSTSGIPIWTAHGKTLPYGGHASDRRWLPTPTRVPQWPNVALLPSASATSHVPTWGIGFGDEYEAGLARTIQGLWDAAGRVGVEPYHRDTNVVRTVFVQEGAVWTWDVDLRTAEMTVREDTVKGGE